MRLSELKITLALLCLLLVHSSFGFAETRSRCSLQNCFSQLDDHSKEKVLNGEMISRTEKTDSKFNIIYVYKRVRGVDPELAMGMFATFAEHPANIKGIVESEVMGIAQDKIRVRYVLDVSQAGAGTLSKLAPISTYALDEKLVNQADGEYVITWEINSSETSRLNRKLEKPEYVHGFMFIEAIPGTTDSIMTYANYVVPAGLKARIAAPLVNSTGVKVLEATAKGTAEWFERVASLDQTDLQDAYRITCRKLLGK